MMRLREMNAADIDNVVCIEQEVQPYPWTRGNFSDALQSGYLCRVYESDEGISGYAILMPAVDEAQLLIIGVAAAFQRKGHGSRLLGEMKELARGMSLHRMLLEVRPSNVAALALYRTADFMEIGRRRGYYAAQDRPGEDAIVMECIL